jgi:hypothetical protein
MTATNQHVVLQHPPGHFRIGAALDLQVIEPPVVKLQHQVRTTLTDFGIFHRQRTTAFATCKKPQQAPGLTMEQILEGEIVTHRANLPRMRA